MISTDTRRRILRHLAALDLLDDRDPAAARAETLLIRFGAKAFDLVVHFLDHPNPIVRFRVAWVLGKMGEPRAFEPLCRLLGDTDERVRYDAARALSFQDDERKFALLRPLFEDPTLTSAVAHLYASRDDE